MRMTPNRQQGVALLEVLISLLILGLALLGLAQLQITSTRQSYHANFNYLAAQQITDITERMRANSSGLSAGNYNNVSGIPGSSPNCSTGTCSPSQMATYDIVQWNTTNSQVLPSGTGTVQGTGAGFFYTVTVNWVEPEIGNRSMSMKVMI